MSEPIIIYVGIVIAVAIVSWALGYLMRKSGDYSRGYDDGAAASVHGNPYPEQQRQQPPPEGDISERQDHG